MLWDLYQHYQIAQLESRVDRAQTATAEDSGARRATLHLEERVDRLVLLCRAMFELLQESTGHTEERLSAKILEIDLRDGRADGKMSPHPTRCPKCEAMMSPRFGRCLFCGEQSAAGPAL